MSQGTAVSTGDTPKQPTYRAGCFSALVRGVESIGGGMREGAAGRLRQQLLPSISPTLAGPKSLGLQHKLPLAAAQLLMADAGG